MSDATATVTISNQLGLHARASAKFCDLANGFDATVSVTKDQLTVGGCSLMALLMLGAGKGSTITIAANGPEAEKAVTALVGLVEDRFHEKS